MIYHYKDNLTDIPYTLKTSLKYSDEFTFIPLKIKTNDFILQTPRLFVPYGIQTNKDISKRYVMVSFQNKVNDMFTKDFLSDLQYLYQLIKEYYGNTYQVNPFIKSYMATSLHPTH